MDKMIEEFLDDRIPAEIKECVNNEDYDKKEITVKNGYEGVINRDITENERGIIQDTLDKVIEECPDETSSVEMEEGVYDKVDDENEKLMRKKRKMKQPIYESTTIVQGKGVNNERDGKDVDLVEGA